MDLTKENKSLKTLYKYSYDGKRGLIALKKIKKEKKPLEKKEIGKGRGGAPC